MYLFIANIGKLRYNQTLNFNRFIKKQVVCLQIIFHIDYDLLK